MTNPALIAEIDAERVAQKHQTAEVWMNAISAVVDDAFYTEKYRKAFRKIAALAIAAIESLDRKKGKP